MTTSVSEYQNRLREFIRAAMADGTTMRELARRMGDESYRSQISYWLNHPMSRTLRQPTYERLAKIDPYQRTPSEIEVWLTYGIVACGEVCQRTNFLLAATVLCQSAA